MSSVGPNAIQIERSACLAVVMLSPQRTRRFQLNTDRSTVGATPTGSFEIVPGGSSLFAEWGDHKESLVAAFEEDRLKRLAGQEFDQQDFELHPPRMGLIDTRALDLAHGIQHELQAGKAGMHEAIDAWLTLMGVHILRKYSSLSRKPMPVFRGGLSPRSWSRVDEYIRTHLSQKIRIEDLAEIAQLSPSHFSRSFRQTIGHSPHQYIVALRLNIARKLIAKSSASIDEISRIAGFSSNSHMTATMQRLWGTKPMQFRQFKS